MNDYAPINSTHHPFPISATHALFKRMKELSSQEVTLQKQFQFMMKMAGERIFQASTKEEGAMLVQALYLKGKKYVLCLFHKKFNETKPSGHDG